MDKKETYSMLAKTSFGFEDMLIEELKEIGAQNLRKGVRVVHFDGDLETMYRANLHSRLALRILKPIKSFPAANEQQLYDEIKKIDWSQYLSSKDTLAVDAVTSYSTLTHTLYISLKTKDAIVDQFRDATGVRPNVDLRFPKIRVNVHIHMDVASVSIDSSGDSLHKRGYRSEQGEAPLNETLAAGMIMWSKWDRKSNFTDLMCGSGTLVIEAAMMARNIAPGIFRNEFGFERWNDYDAVLWKRLFDEAKAAEKTEVDFSITGIDKLFQTIKNAKENARGAGVLNSIEFHAMPFEDYTPSDSVQTIVTNPPYGGRITDDDLFNLYKTIGDNLKTKYAGSTAWVLTANREAAKFVGLHPTAKIPMYNGALECRMLKYVLYRGTKKIHKLKDGEDTQVQ